MSINTPTVCSWASIDVVMFSIELSKAILGDLPALKPN